MLYGEDLIPFLPLCPLLTVRELLILTGVVLCRAVKYNASMTLSAGLVFVFVVGMSKSVVWEFVGRCVF